MNANAAESPTTEQERASETLWRSWFDAASAAVAEADRMLVTQSPIKTACLCTTDESDRLQRLYQDARVWLAAAVKQATGLAKESSSQRLGLTQAARTWVLFQLGENDAAAAAAAKACESLPTGENASLEVRQNLARVYYVLGQLAHQQDKPAEAHSRFRSALNLFQLAGANARRWMADVLERLGEIESATRDFAEAVEHLALAVRLWDEQGDPYSRIPILLSRQAAAHIEMSRFRTALAVHRRWQSSIDKQDRKTVDFEEQARVFGYLLLLYGRYREAGQLFDEAWVVLGGPAIVNDRLGAKLARHQTELKISTGDYRSAIRLLGHAKLGPSAGQHKLREYILHGEVSLAFGEFEASKAAFSEASSLLESGTQANLGDRFAMWLGIVRTDVAQGALTAAVNRAKDVIGLLEDHSRIVERRMALALHELARARFRQNYPAESAPICDRAITLLEMAMGQNHPENVELLTTCAEIHWSRGDIRQGMSACDEATTLLANHRPCDSFAQARIDTVRARLFHLQRNVAAARSCLLSAWNGWTAKESHIDHEHPEKSLTILVVATIFTGLGDKDQADQLYSLATPLMMELKDNKQERVAYELNWQGNIYFGLEFYREAKWLYEHACTHYQQQFGAEHKNTETVRKNILMATKKLTSGEEQEPATMQSELEQDDGSAAVKEALVPFIGEQ